MALVIHLRLVLLVSYCLDVRMAKLNESRAISNVLKLTCVGLIERNFASHVLTIGLRLSSLFVEEEG